MVELQGKIICGMLNRAVYVDRDVAGKAEKHIINGTEAGDDIKGFFDVAITIVKGKFPG